MWGTIFRNGMSDVALGSVDVVCVGRIRRHGTTKNGLPKFEGCLDNDYVTTPMIREAVERNRVMYAVVLLSDGVAIPINNKPYIDRGQVCVALHMKFNDLWERLWQAGKPVLIKFVVRV